VSADEGEGPGGRYLRGRGEQRKVGGVGGVANKGDHFYKTGTMGTRERGGGKNSDEAGSALKWGQPVKVTRDDN